MNSESKVTLIGALSGAIAGITVSIISGYFSYSTKQSEFKFEREKISEERQYKYKKQLRELIAQYNVATNLLYAKIRSNDIANTLEDLLKIRNLAEEIKLMGSLPVTEQLNKHSMALLDYFNKFSTEGDSKLHDNYIKQSAEWVIVTRMQFEITI